MKSFKNRLGLFFVTASALVILAFSSTSARAQVLFDNGAPDLGAGGEAVYFADAGGDPYAAGNIFTPTASGTAMSISFAGVYYNGGTVPTQPTTDNFTIYLYSVTPGSPDSLNTEISQSTLSSVTASVIATSLNGFPIYQFSGNLTTPFVLSTASEYYVGISDGTNPYEGFAVDATATSGASINGWQLSPEGNLNFPTSLSFALSQSAVPEPSTWAMLLGGLGLLTFWHFRIRFARV